MSCGFRSIRIALTTRQLAQAAHYGLTSTLLRPTYPRGRVERVINALFERVESIPAITRACPRDPLLVQKLRNPFPKVILRLSEAACFVQAPLDASLGECRSLAWRQRLLRSGAFRFGFARSNAVLPDDEPMPASRPCPTPEG